MKLVEDCSVEMKKLGKKDIVQCKPKMIANDKEILLYDGCSTRRESKFRMEEGLKNVSFP